MRSKSMSDYIKREDAITAWEEWAVNLINPKFIVKEDAICALKDIPSADVVEVVRCKDCKWYMEYIPRKGESAMMCFCNCCIGGQGKKKPTDYCSYGERKEDDDGQGKSEKV